MKPPYKLKRKGSETIQVGNHVWKQRKWFSERLWRLCDPRPRPTPCFSSSWLFLSHILLEHTGDLLTKMFL